MDIGKKCILFGSLAVHIYMNSVISQSVLVFGKIMEGSIKGKEKAIGNQFPYQTCKASGSHPGASGALHQSSAIF